MSKRQDAIDPAVADLLGDAAHREEDRRKSKEQRAKARRDAKRNRVTYDVPPVLENVVSELAEREGLSKSATASLLMAQSVQKYINRTLVFTGHKTPTRHPLYEWVVDEETIEEILRGKRSLEE